jgi:hypothetical protein
MARVEEKKRMWKILSDGRPYYENESS